MKTTKTIPVIDDDEFIRLFESEDEDYLQYCDLDNVRRPGMETRTMDIDSQKSEFNATAGDQPLAWAGAIKTAPKDAATPEGIDRAIRDGFRRA